MFSSTANVTHTVILRPLAAGVYNISWATLSYVNGEEGQTHVSYVHNDINDFLTCLGWFY